MKNIILVAGPFADGKTSLIRHVMKEFQLRGIRYDPKVITDSTFMLDAVSWDDQVNRGRNHMHSEHSVPQEHVHAPGTKMGYDFVVTGYAIQYHMFRDFFYELSKPRPTNRFYFAELAGGVNILNDSHPASVNDYSFLTMAKEMMYENYETSWINQLACVLHPRVAEFSQRQKFNQERGIRLITDENIANGSESWPLPEVVMQYTGIDDFAVFQRFLENQGVSPSQIHTLENNGGPMFFKDAIQFLESRGAFDPERMMRTKEGE